MIGTHDKIKKLIEDIVNTRNYLTHYDVRLKNKALRGLKLVNINEKLEGLLELSFLKELDFSKEEINTIFKKSIKKEV